MTIATLVQHLSECTSDLRAEFDADDYLVPELLAVLLSEIRSARVDLGSWEQEVVHKIADRAPKRFEVAGLGEVEVKYRTKRTAWKIDDLVASVIARAMDEPDTIYDPQTGELLPYVAIGARLAAKLRSCVGMTYGKVTGMRDMGLQPDEFCSEQPGEVQVLLPKREIV